MGFGKAREDALTSTHPTGRAFILAPVRAAEFHGFATPFNLIEAGD